MHHAPGGQDLLRRGLDHQAGLDRIGAGIHQAGAGRLADFHHAEAAVALGFEFRVVAQGGNVDAVGLGRQQERGPRRRPGPVCRQWSDSLNRFS